MKAVVGIDPGKTGAIALLGADGYFVVDYSDPYSAADILRTWWRTHLIETVFLEKVNALPRQGVSSMFSFGTSYGICIGIVAALRINITYVRPQEWQAKMFGMYSPASMGKTRSLEVAKMLFPDAGLNLKKHHGRADALLIAKYGWDYLC